VGGRGRKKGNVLYGYAGTIGSEIFHSHHHRMIQRLKILAVTLGLAITCAIPRRARFAAMLAAFSSAISAADFAPAHYDLSALPPYKPEQMALGVVRIYGTPLESLVGRWANEFRAKQGHVRLEAYLINTSQAFAGLLTGKADIGVMGHRTWHTSLMAFEKAFGYAPLEIRFATGSYDDPEGSTPGLMFIVHKSNPLNKLTLEQIDGIFGAQRSGGWNGTKWSTAAARGPERNIRTWGQLGLTGEWADKPIHPRGSDVTLSNWADLIEREAFKGGKKWNPALYEGPRADISWKAHGKTRDQQIIEGVQDDPLAIGFMFQRVINATKSDVKVLPLAASAGGPFITPSAQTFFDGSYPMHNGAYLYLNRVPGKPLSPRDKEFVRFVLSREGQQIVADSRIFIPLNAAQAQAELEKLD
jgi:phosphate transport system substrate-binding protein